MPGAQIPLRRLTIIIVFGAHQRLEKDGGLRTPPLHALGSF